MPSIRSVLKAIVPKPVRMLRHGTAGRYLRYMGLRHRCPICGARVRRFMDAGTIHKYPNEECPVCESHRRHRLIWLYFRDKMRLAERPPFRLLHVAPELRVGDYLAGLPNVDYVSGDLGSPRAMVKMDLLAIPFPDAEFDAVYCSHVLEHVPDDRKAMAELFRVLKPGGWAILQVPIDGTRATTYEDASITTPEGREVAFWQYDHVRLYGRDYPARLAEAGFEVEVDWYVRTLSPDLVRKYNLDPDEAVYLCRKPAAG